VSKNACAGILRDPIADSEGERRIIFPQSIAIGGDSGYARFAQMIQLGFLSHKRAPRIEHQVVDAVGDKRLAIAIDYSNLSRCGRLSWPKTSFIGNVKTGKRRLRLSFEFIRCRGLSRPCYVADDLAV
jgi:hypothetical protein